MKFTDKHVHRVPVERRYFPRFQEPLSRNDFFYEFSRDEAERKVDLFVCNDFMELKK